jgi:hypothetical protein
LYIVVTWLLDMPDPTSTWEKTKSSGWADSLVMATQRNNSSRLFLGFIIVHMASDT